MATRRGIWFGDGDMVIAKSGKAALGLLKAATKTKISEYYFRRYYSKVDWHKEAVGRADGVYESTRCGNTRAWKAVLAVNHANP